MTWIDELDKYGENVLIDELVFHLENGREIISVAKIDDSVAGPGYMFIICEIFCFCWKQLCCILEEVLLWITEIIY